MIYCTECVRTDHYEKKNNKKIYYYTAEEFKEIVKDLKENGITPEITGSIDLAHVKKEKKLKNKKKNYLYIERDFFLIKDTLRTKKLIGYIPLGDNKFLQYVNSRNILKPIFLILEIVLWIALIAFMLHLIKKGPLQDNPSEEITSTVAPTITPDDDEQSGTIYQPNGEPDMDVATITFTGYPNELTFNEKNKYFYMNNSEVNIFYLKYTISDEKGKPIFESGYISPGHYALFDMYKYINENGKPESITVIAKGYTNTGEGLNSFLYNITIN